MSLSSVTTNGNGNGIGVGGGGNGQEPPNQTSHVSLAGGLAEAVSLYLFFFFLFFFPPSPLYLFIEISSLLFQLVRLLRWIHLLTLVRDLEYG